MPKARGKKRRDDTPEFEVKARKHFERRWRERISGTPPNYEVLKDAIRQAARGAASPFFTFDRHTPPYSSRWFAQAAGKDIVIAYDHAMKLPVSCWVKGE